MLELATFLSDFRFALPDDTCEEGLPTVISRRPSWRRLKVPAIFRQPCAGISALSRMISSRTHGGFGAIRRPTSGGGFLEARARGLDREDAMDRLSSINERKATMIKPAEASRRKSSILIRE